MSQNTEVRRRARGRRPTLEVAVLLFDPSLPYSFSHTGEVGEEELEAAQQLREALAAIPGYHFTIFNQHDRFIDDLRAARIDLALNFCDVGYRNDWNRVQCIPAFLDMLDIPCTGSDALALLLSSDKVLARALAVDLAIPVPDEMLIDLTAVPLALPRFYPALIKPRVGGGSFGLTKASVVYDRVQAREHLEHLSGELDSPMVIAQEFLTGPEYSVGVLGNPQAGLEVLPVVEIDYSNLDSDLPAIFTYGAKFKPESRYYRQLEHMPADLSAARSADLSVYSRQLFQRLGFRDYGRFDFRCDEGGVVRFLDANPNPTWYQSSRLAMMASWAGHEYPELLRIILEAAVERCQLGGVLPRQRDEARP